MKDDVFTINFHLKYTEYGGLIVKEEMNDYFDVGDYNILLDNAIKEFTEEKLKEYDNGILILSVCKYIVDALPNLYSINYEANGVVDTYFKEEIIEDYHKIKKYKEMNETIF